MTDWTPPDGAPALKRIREWRRNGHHVVLATVESADDDVNDAPPFLACECDYAPDGTTHVDECPAKTEVRRSVMREQREANAERWNAMTLGAAILDVHDRVHAREYFGQHVAGMVYLQEVAEILGRDPEETRRAVHALQRAERIDLNGAILTDYEPHFRIPTLMAQIMELTVGIPLGSPNGDAGAITVAEFQQEVSETLGYAHGIDAFGAQFPDMDPALCAKCVVNPLVDVLHACTSIDDLDALMEEDGLRTLRIRVVSTDGATALPSAAYPVIAAYLAKMLDVAADRIRIYRAHDADATTRGDAPRKPFSDADVLCEVADEMDGVIARLTTTHR